MTIISNDPSWWLLINSYLLFSYFMVAISTGVIYDWVLAFGQEVELIWVSREPSCPKERRNNNINLRQKQHWSLMTVMYLTVRYVGVVYAGVNIQSYYMYFALYWTIWVLIAILGGEPTQLRYLDFTEISCKVIMIARLHAMYQRSRKVLVLLVVVFTAIVIANIVMLTINMKYISSEQAILSGTYQCIADNLQCLGTIPWILTGVWEVFTLCLAVRIALKHFRELRQHSAGGIIRDCFVVLMKTHVSYFVSSVVVLCLCLGYCSPTMPKDPYSPAIMTYFGFLEIFTIVQSAVLGPQLILGVREYYARLMIDFDAGPNLSSIAFQESVHVSTSNSM
ncbi:uncharacterized protein HD556DRAFT_1484507 [Suillus plorans]|uniref:DUF6533 domain-containing protein n=1 Tax=Suillus plorans TaxID=116603 RepID=A0A9P7J5D1_9AGAM|nr:uncharacterized protein HD556DRAFT_1484507 [Suillus plorans]KAG1803886.1 hypothetical protein HD556DRAFT_1484507 [Suillus plorans]